MDMHVGYKVGHRWTSWLHDLLTDLASIFNLAGRSTYVPLSDAEAIAADRAALRGDWVAVGQDLASAMPRVGQP